MLCTQSQGSYEEQKTYKTTIDETGIGVTTPCPYPHNHKPAFLGVATVHHYEIWAVYSVPAICLAVAWATDFWDVRTGVYDPLSFGTCLHPPKYPWKVNIPTNHISKCVYGCTVGSTIFDLGRVSTGVWRDIK
jgi:hypothetical protein